LAIEMRSLSVFRLVKLINTGIAARGLATEIREVKVASKKVAAPPRLVEKAFNSEKKDSNIINKRENPERNEEGLILV